jgi:hypothetical protein
VTIDRGLLLLIYDDRFILSRQPMEVQEWKLKTDIIAFETELRLFVLRYPSHTTRLLRFGINRGLLERLRLALDDMRMAQIDPPPVRSFSITMSRPRILGRLRWLPVRVKVGVLVVRRISNEHIVLAVRARSEDGHPFIADFLQHCQELWEAVRLDWATDASRTMAEPQISAVIVAPASQPSDIAVTPRTKRKTERKRRTAQLSTADKLDRLRAIRRDHLKENRVSITFTAACNLVPVDSKTVNEHAPELRRHWDDPTYIT